MLVTKSRATVLIVDDTPDNLRILAELMRPHYAVKVANSGRRALEIAASTPVPDLILLDVMMPEMDGYECLRRLQQKPETRDIPVMFVTALDSTEDERLGLDMGAVDYITKPIRPAVVEARVRNHMEMKLARDWLMEQNGFLAAELNRFLEILAHHLQEPVRRQVTFTQLLQRSLPRPLNETAQISLEQILEGANRLRAMLTDVLAYLAVTQLSDVQTICQTDEALETAIRSLSAKIARTQADLVIHPLPPLWINARQLSEVFRALLDNALEYRHPDRFPHVVVQAQDRDGQVVITICDNGGGIATEFRDQAFWIFERLQSEATHPNCGTGIGLAMVKKIVETAHGRVWLEDGEDGGLMVCLSLPQGIDRDEGTEQ